MDADPRAQPMARRHSVRFYENKLLDESDNIGTGSNHSGVRIAGQNSNGLEQTSHHHRGPLDDQNLLDCSDSTHTTVALPFEDEFGSDDDDYDLSYGSLAFLYDGLYDNFNDLGASCKMEDSFMSREDIEEKFSLSAGMEQAIFMDDYNIKASGMFSKTTKRCLGIAVSLIVVVMVGGVGFGRTEDQGELEEAVSVPVNSPTLGAPTTLFVPADSPTGAPTMRESEMIAVFLPADSPTGAPSGVPSEAPSMSESEMIAEFLTADSPTAAPSEAPTAGPTQAPTMKDSEMIAVFLPVDAPTGAPSYAPSTTELEGDELVPADSPTESPTQESTEESTKELPPQQQHQQHHVSSEYAPFTAAPTTEATDERVPPQLRNTANDSTDAPSTEVTTEGTAEFGG